MNKRGFTLVEGLLVIAIIGIILMAIVPNVITLINKNKVKSCESTIENIISTAKMYVAENKYNMNFDCNGTAKYVGIDDLKNNGYLKDGTNIIGTKVRITYDCGSKTFTYKVVDDSDDEVTCES